VVEVVAPTEEEAELGSLQEFKITLRLMKLEREEREIRGTLVEPIIPTPPSDFDMYVFYIITYINLTIEK
jgi:hypothetical protein